MAEPTADPADPTSDEPDEISRFVADLFDGALGLNRQELAARSGASRDRIKYAVTTGALHEIRVSPRRLVITPSAYERYLRLLAENPERIGARATG